MNDDRTSTSLDPFVRAVVRQLSESPRPAEGSDGDGSGGGIESAVRRYVARAVSGEATHGAGAELAGDVPLLASFFQNVDLLYEHGYPEADAVSGLIMAALERLDLSGGG